MALAVAFRYELRVGVIGVDRSSMARFGLKGAGKTITRFFRIRRKMTLALISCKRISLFIRVMDADDGGENKESQRRQKEQRRISRGTGITRRIGQIGR